ncbi:ABC transporter ATP-binding protein [Thermaurantiacus tibetensis]|uniref:ABC transporter ATP-binding protein n=1 Tax=Thermaurantiacus tibetensis TaxID=2759035 RepID=UPI002E2B195D|nr:ABC transporter ATP-binding protein [Thermaurantiacus tibetensis]
MTAPVLAAEGLRVERAGFALGPLALALVPGRVLAILGPNGAGKSTLLMALAGLVPAAGGAVLLDGRRLAALPPKMRARAVGYLPQGGDVHWNLSARALVMLGRTPHRPPVGPPGPADVAAVDAALAATDALHLAGRPVRALSGGERARVLLARVLAGAPRVLLADEPLQNLDPAHQLATVALLRDAAARGAAVAAVVHDLPLARRLADDALLLVGGRVLAAGPAAEVLAPGPLARAFGIRVSAELVPVAAAGEAARADG